MTKDIYDLELHEILKVHETLRVIRVPGGWIYAWEDSTSLTTIFVPFNNEFADKFKGAL